MTTRRVTVVEIPRVAEQHRAVQVLVFEVGAADGLLRTWQCACGCLFDHAGMVRHLREGRR